MPKARLPSVKSPHPRPRLVPPSTRTAAAAKVVDAAPGQFPTAEQQLQAAQTRIALTRAGTPPSPKPLLQQLVDNQGEILRRLSAIESIGSRNHRMLSALLGDDDVSTDPEVEDGVEYVDSVTEESAEETAEESESNELPPGDASPLESEEPHGGAA